MPPTRMLPTLEVTVRDLLFVTWRLTPESVQAVVPAGLALDLSEGSALVTLSVARATSGRLGRLRVPRFAKLTVHTYVEGPEGPGLCSLYERVSRSAFGRRLVGVPFGGTRIRARRGSAAAPEVGVRIDYRIEGEAAQPPPTTVGPLGSHELAYFESAGQLLAIRAPHDPIDWRRATPNGARRHEPVANLGLDAGEPDSVFYADRVGFRVELPPGFVRR